MKTGIKAYERPHLPNKLYLPQGVRGGQVSTKKERFQIFVSDKRFLDNLIFFKILSNGDIEQVFFNKLRRPAQHLGWQYASEMTFPSNTPLLLVQHNIGGHLKRWKFTYRIQQEKQLYVVFLDRQKEIQLYLKNKQIVTKLEQEEEARWEPILQFVRKKTFRNKDRKGKILPLS